MKALIDVLHPAHVHFFRNAIDILRERGHGVVLTARDKDITVELLHRLGLTAEVLSTEARGVTGRGGELLTRNRKLWRIVRRERPDVMASVGGVSTAQVGFLTRTRNLIFYDTENATLSNLISYPFATEVLTPDCYRRRVLGRHVTYPGYHELAYLHPKRFAPDEAIPRDAGVRPDEPYSIVRFVSWRALHDTRKTRGFAPEGKRALIQILQRAGRVFITSEDQLPSDLQPHTLPVPPHQIHHLLAFADLFVGESSTMVSESVILGTPAVYVDAFGTSPTDELEERYGLCSTYRPSQLDAVSHRCEAIMRQGLKYDREYQHRRATMLSEKIDVTAFIVAKLSGEM